MAPASVETLKKFGKFFLLDLIAQGGMAEIYRARTATPDGGSRLLAIKRILASYTQNPEFVTMFKSEIKTTSGFTHPNIVQLYDFGEEQGMLYLAMELVDGKNLRQFISRFVELKTSFPVDISVYILEQAALAMAYAHSYKDKISGKSMNIVHRDISPQNILISYDGAVKVIDFGIAKAVTNAEATRAGVIKGKPSYLSPEQVSGETLDGKSDIFALGIVLWELLTGKKLFASDNDYGVLKLIENCTNHIKPPSMHNPKVPKELDAIVLKCLQKNRDQRYANAEEMQRALHKFLYQFSPDFNPADLGYYARDLFKNEIVEDRKRLLKLNEKVEALIAIAPPEPKFGGEAINDESTVALVSSDEESTDPGLEPRTTQTQRKASVPKPGDSGSFRVVEFNEKEKTNVTLDYGSGGNPSRPRPTNATRTISRPQPQPTAERKRSPMAAVFLVAALGAGYWYYSTQLHPGDGAVGRTITGGTLIVQGNVKAATITVDGKSLSSGLPAELKSIPTDRPVKLLVSANGYRTVTQEISLTAGETKTISVDLAREDGGAEPQSAAVAANPGGATTTLKLNINPPGLGTQIKVNGADIDISGVAQVPVGVSLDLLVEREGFRKFHKTFTVEPARAGADFALDVPLEAARFGYVTIKTTPSAEAILTIDGVEERLPTPVSRKRIPVGTYKAKLVNSVLGMEREVSFTVNEDRFTNIEERLLVTDDQAPSRVPAQNK